MKIFVMGYGRSGSTLFESLLVDQFKANSFGEVKYFSERGVLKNERCSCGSNAHDCEFWSSIMRDFTTEEISIAKKHTDHLESSKFFFINLFLMKLGFFKEKIRQYQDFNSKLYSLLGQYGHFIDSSKMPARAYFLNLGKVESQYSKIYWVVRDPRGVAWSCMKEVIRSEANSESDRMMPKFGYYSSLLKWLMNSLVSYFVYKKHENVEIVKYEDFSETLRSASKVQDFNPLEHSISGNPARFKGTLKTISKDLEWEKSLSLIKKRLAPLICFPMFQLLGYRL